MAAITLTSDRYKIKCNYRPLILIAIGLVLFGVFWFTSRYPSLLGKAEHVGQSIASMAYGSERIRVAADAALWEKIIYGAVNWIDGMKVGMTFGVLLGALLHTTLRYYPLKVSKNLYLNSLKGAVIGVPAAICANCSVPVICGVTRGNGRVEMALGFLFSSPNFNPVVVTMTFVALPLSMALTKYAILLFVIMVLVPVLIGWLERDKPLAVQTTFDEGAICELPLGGRELHRIVRVGPERVGARLPEECVDVGQTDNHALAGGQSGSLAAADTSTMAISVVRDNARAGLSGRHGLGVHAGADRIGGYVRGRTLPPRRAGRIRDAVPDDAGNIQHRASALPVARGFQAACRVTLLILPGRWMRHGACVLMATGPTLAHGLPVPVPIKVWQNWLAPMEPLGRYTPQTPACSRYHAARISRYSRQGAAMTCTPMGSAAFGNDTGTAATGRPINEIGCG